MIALSAKRPFLTEDFLIVGIDDLPPQLILHKSGGTVLNQYIFRVFVFHRRGSSLGKSWWLCCLHSSISPDMSLGRRRSRASVSSLHFLLQTDIALNNGSAFSANLAITSVDGSIYSYALILST